MGKSAEILINEIQHSLDELKMRAPAMAAGILKNKLDSAKLENETLKNSIGIISKSRDAFKGLYNKKNKYSLRLESEIKNLKSLVNSDHEKSKKQIDELERQNILLRTEIETLKRQNGTIT